jgi:hypothetical protein
MSQNGVGVPFHEEPVSQMDLFFFVNKVVELLFN